MTILFRHAKILYVRLRVAYARKVHARHRFKILDIFISKRSYKIFGKAFRSGY